MPGPAPNLPGDYGSKRAARNAQRRDGDWDVYEVIEPVVKPAPEHWTDLARDIYLGYHNDPIARQWTQHDWSLAFLLCEAIHRADTGGTLHRGTTLASLIDGMAKLGAGPMERRRARVQLVEGSDRQLAHFADIAKALSDYAG